MFDRNDGVGIQNDAKRDGALDDSYYLDSLFRFSDLHFAGRCLDVHQQQKL